MMIEVKDLVKRYGSLKAVDGVSFSVPAGRIFAFLGPNGAGKTTTVKMMTTVLKPTTGQVVIDGHDAARDPRGARRVFGIVFQDPSLDNELTAAENMELHGVLYGVPGPARRQRAERLLRLVELWDRRDDLVKRFSGGMARRLEIARALLHEPKLLFLDEPTVGLDPQTRNHIWGFLRTLGQQRGTTVFFTTHYLEEADRYADEIAVIDCGRIVAQGTASELKRQANAATLDDAFIALTGHALREEEAAPGDHMRQMGKLWGGRR